MWVGVRVWAVGYFGRVLLYLNTSTPQHVNTLTLPPLHDVLQVLEQLCDF
jgi:hypothetical protein